MDRASLSHPIIAIEGLPGSGKTFLISQFAQSRCEDGTYNSFVWYTPQQDESLDETLLQIGTEITLESLSTRSRARDLIGELRRTRSALIVDDYHLVDQSSFAPLLDEAAKAGVPGVLFLTSQTFVDAVRSWAVIGHIEVNGFSVEEIRSLLKMHEIVLSDEILSLLYERTDGLPIALSLFTILVAQFNREPADLLASNVELSVRLRNWFDDISQRIQKDQHTLLNALSIYEVPFNLGTVREICEIVQVANPNALLEALQKSFLVQRHSPYRWRVHHLIALFATEEVDDERKQTLLKSFAERTLRKLPAHQRFFSEVEVLSAIRGVRFFQRAKDYARSEPLLLRLTASIKKRGLYDMFVSAAEVEMAENVLRNPWTDYHACHCYLITGRIQRAFEIIEPLTMHGNLLNANQRLSIGRLYAELLGSVGRHETALQKLREARAAVATNEVDLTAALQARSTEANLLTASGRYAEAALIGSELLTQSRRKKDRRGEAVAMTLIGVASTKRKRLQDGESYLENAAHAFKECDDARGEAWALVELAENQAFRGKIPSSEAIITRGIGLSYRIGLCSIDYRELLKRMLGHHLSSDTEARIHAELSRLEKMLETQPSLARRNR